jgi:hypothetical protein
MTHMTAHQLRRIEDLLLDIPAFCRQGSEASLKNFLSDSLPLRAREARCRLAGLCDARRRRSC